MTTRMHSSGMHTARLLTVSQHALGRGVYPSIHWVGGVSQHALGRRGVCPGWVSAHGGICPEGCVADTPPPWTDRHLWKHNLRKLRLRAVTSLCYLSHWLRLWRFFRTSTVMVHIRWPTQWPRPIQILIKCVQNPIEVCISVCLWTVWRPPHNSAQAIFIGLFFCFNVW